MTVLKIYAYYFQNGTRTNEREKEKNCAYYLERQATQREKN